MPVGTTRTPRPHYDNKFVVEFFTKNNIVFYRVLKWDDSGENQSLIKTGEYNGEDPKSLITEIIGGNAE